MQKRAQSGCLYHPHHICLGSEAEVPSPSRLSRALHPQHWLPEKRQSRSCQERASFKAKWHTQHMQLSLPRAIRAITPHHQQPPVGLPIPSGAGLPGRAWGGGEESGRAQPFTRILHFRKSNAPASTQDRQCAMEQQLPSQHPAASLHLQPSLGFQLFLPHLPNTAKLLLPFACPPLPLTQKVSFEIQGSGGRNVAGSGVREAERGGISSLQPFASTNQQL